MLLGMGNAERGSRDLYQPSLLMTHVDRRPEVAGRRAALEGRTARAIALRGSLRSHLRTTVKVNEGWY
jgi:hypothetical protein